MNEKNPPRQQQKGRRKAAPKFCLRGGTCATALAAELSVVPSSLTPPALFAAVCDVPSRASSPALSVALLAAQPAAAARARSTANSCGGDAWPSEAT
eukprot:6212995-Pleurochrysis_carterae.AAC.2